MTDTELDKAIDKMLTWNIAGHTEPVVFQPEMKQAIKKLISAHDKALKEKLLRALPSKARDTQPVKAITEVFGDGRK